MRLTRQALVLALPVLHAPEKHFAILAALINTR
jgi:hypothetical protein